MNVSILDLGGNFLGPALGFVSLGHEVSYFRRGELSKPLSRVLGPLPAEPLFDADLVVCAASFSDEHWAREEGVQRDAPVDASDPFFETINPKQREFRDAWLGPRLDAAPDTVLVDVSDMSGPLDPFFLEHGSLRFKREMPEAQGAPIEPFPFLYHPRLVELEWTLGLSSVLLPLEERGDAQEILFAGTVAHARYGGRRRALLERMSRERPWLELRVIEGGLSVLQCWRALQLARGGLYLPGRGELCFRLHELAALGVPALAAEAPRAGLPAEWDEVLQTEPARMRTPYEMLDFYRCSYHPTQAAQSLLGGVATPRDARPVLAR